MIAIKQHTGKYNKVQGGSDEEAVGKFNNKIRSMLSSMKTLKKEKKEQKQGLIQRRVEKSRRKQKEEQKVWPSFNDEFDFRHRNKYKDNMLLITKNLQKDDTNKDKYDAYNEDKQGREQPNNKYKT